MTSQSHGPFTLREMYTSTINKYLVRSRKRVTEKTMYTQTTPQLYQGMKWSTFPKIVSEHARSTQMMHTPTAHQISYTIKTPAAITIEALKTLNKN